MSIWCTYFTKSFVIQPFRKLIRFQSVFGGRQQQYGLFLQIDAMCCDSHSIQGLFKVFSAILSRGKTHFSLVMSLNRKTNISSNCSSVCIPPPPSCAHDSVSISNVAPLPLHSAWTHIQPVGISGWYVELGAESARTLSWYCGTEHSFIQSCSGWPALLEHHCPASSYMSIMLCGIFWCSLTLLCDLAKGVL